MKKEKNRLTTAIRIALVALLHKAEKKNPLQSPVTPYNRGISDILLLKKNKNYDL